MEWPKFLYVTLPIWLFSIAERTICLISCFLYPLAVSMSASSPIVKVSRSYTSLMDFIISAASGFIYFFFCLWIWYKGSVCRPLGCRSRDMVRNKGLTMFKWKSPFPLRYRRDKDSVFFHIRKLFGEKKSESVGSWSLVCPDSPFNSFG